MKLDLPAVEILRGVEGEFRNQYWRIRNARRTDWKAVNRTRVLAEVMRVCGVPAEAIKEARYCLRVRVCERCADQPNRCHELTVRALRGDFS
jgi:hypothetical protein